MRKAIHSIATGELEMVDMTAEEIAEVEARPQQEAPVDRLAALEAKVAELEGKRQ